MDPLPTADQEIKAMSEVVEALATLDSEAVARVIEWVAKRYNVQIGTSPRRGPTPPPSESSATPDLQVFEDFHELFDAANPTAGPDKALVAGYWFQVLQGEETLDSQKLNSALKDLGHPSTNITRDLDALINRNPRYVMQVRKEGTQKQSRKKYKLTREGIKAVQRMLSNKDTVAEESAPVQS